MEQSNRQIIEDLANSLTEPPVIDMEAYIQKRAGVWQGECHKVVASLHKFGILIVKDPRVNHETNEEYLDMVEGYFELQGERFYRGEKLKDCHPELSYQTGVTPESIERARDHGEILKTIPKDQQPQSPYPPEFDAKWRFFWPIGERDDKVKNDLPKVIPEEFPEWENKMDNWGNHMVSSAEVAVSMAAIGMGLREDTFTQRMKEAAHLLSPTGSDLTKYGVGTAFAGFHYDLNFITCHGKSRYPGLFIWMRDWTKTSCKMPQGCLLMQAGRMFEWITGGYILAGFHEVIYTQACRDVYDKNVKENEESSETDKKKSLWRVSSTLFAHLRYDVDLTPLSEIAEAGFINGDEARAKYRPMTAFDKLCEELAAINLAPKQSYADSTKQACHDN